MWVKDWAQCSFSSVRVGICLFCLQVLQIGCDEHFCELHRVSVIGRVIVAL